MKWILSSSLIYSFFQNMVGNPRARRVYVSDYIKPKAGEKILDIACGPADILNHLPEDIEYRGFDVSETYIATAKKRFNDLGTFECKSVQDYPVDDNTYDIVLAIGIMHHMVDSEVEGLFRLANRALKPGQRLITVDPVLHSGQSKIERYLVVRDRGKYVRTHEEYQQLIPPYFSKNKCDVRQGLLRIPWSLTIMELVKTGDVGVS